MVQWFRRFSLSTKISFMAVLGVAAFGAFITINTLSIVNEVMVSEAYEKLDANLNFAKAMLHHHGENFEIKEGKLVIGSKVLTGANDVVDTMTKLGGGVMTIFQGDMRVATNATKEDGSRAVGTQLDPTGPAYQSIFRENKPYRGETKVAGKMYFGAYDLIVDREGKAIGVLFTGMNKDEHLAEVHRIEGNVIKISLLIGLFLAVSINLVIRRQLRPLHQMEGVMDALLREQVDVLVPAQDRGDEIGMMAKAVQAFKVGIIEKIKMRTDSEAQKKQVEEERRTMLAAMADEFEESVGQVVKAVSSAASELQGNAQSLSDAADQTSSQTAIVAAATEEASSNVQTVASAAEELAASINEINRQIDQSTHVAGEAVEEVRRTDTTVSTLSEAAAQIGEVVRLIQDIAEQTNLLALNATIEAARAGEAGKGFAVVASEVKNLASQTGRATEEISKKIVTVQTVSGEAVQAIRSIGDIIARIDDITRTIAGAIKQQESATREISNNVQQVSAGTSEISSNISNVTQAADGSRKAAVDVLGASEALSKQADQLGAEIRMFVSSVRQG